MAVMDGGSLGWGMIILGALLLLAEVYSPGFFIAVPATVLLILGILLLMGIDIYSSGWGVLIGVITALIAAGITVLFYSRINRDEKFPTTISRDSLVGKEGIVTVDVDENSLSGKVTIASSDWSAHTLGGIIPAGKRVRVVKSEGVHIVVEEVK